MHLSVSNVNNNMIDVINESQLDFFATQSGYICHSPPKYIYIYNVNSVDCDIIPSSTISKLCV